MREEAGAGDSELAITPDGPRGPRFQCQPGAIYVSRETGMPIVPAGLGFSRCWELPSWDGFQIPKPFAEARIVLGAPIVVPAEISPEQVDRYRRDLENTLRALTREADEGW
jgi:hypothetical protein